MLVSNTLPGYCNSSCIGFWLPNMAYLIYSSTLFPSSPGMGVGVGYKQALDVLELGSVCVEERIESLKICQHFLVCLSVFTD